LPSVFFSYSHADERLRDQLEKQLSLLKRQGVIETWHDRRIVAGHEIDRAIGEHVDKDDIILLLVSADFLASDYCYDIEMTRAMERHAAGEAIVIPVILRACDWHGAPFGKLNATPPDGKPITQWPDIDEAFLHVAKAVRKAAETLGKSNKATSPPPSMMLGASVDEFISMKEAATRTYEALRASGAWDMVPKDPHTIEDPLGWCATYLALRKMPIYGKPPPSRVRELIDPYDLQRRYNFEKSATELHAALSKTNPRFIDLEVKVTDLEAALKGVYDEYKIPPREESAALRLLIRDAAQRAARELDATEMGLFLRKNFQDPEKRLNYLIGSFLVAGLDFVGAQASWENPRTLENSGQLQPITGTSDLRQGWQDSEVIYKDVTISVSELLRYMSMVKSAPADVFGRLL